MKKFNVKPLGAIISGLMMASASQSMFAQTTESTQENSEVEEIVVTGFARSIQNAIDMKRNADTVVQAISAEDIGGLPDASIADALGRIPGITVTRESGQAGTIQVRGMGEGFVFSTLNGREQVSPNGSRAMEFSQFPSELINSVEVYMSPKASLIEGGVAGTVELKTANPLDMQEDQKISIGVRGSFNDQADDNYDVDAYGSRISLSLQKKLMDDTLGLSLGYARLVQPRVASIFEHNNYESTALELNNSTAVVDKNFSAVSTENRPAVVAISNGFDLLQTSGKDTRDGYMAAIQFEPNENLSVQGDVFYSKFESEASQRGWQIQPLNAADIASVVLLENFAVIGGEFAAPDSNAGAFNIQMLNNDESENSELLSGGLNIGWQMDALTLAADFSHSEASGDRARGVVRSHLMRPTDADPSGFQRDPNLSVTYLLDGINVPSMAINRVASNNNQWYDEETGVSDWRMTHFGRYPYFNEDVIDAVRFDGKLELEAPIISSVEAGVRYSERNHKNSRKVFVYGDGEGNIETDYSLPITADTSDVVDWKGDFSHFPSFLAVDGNEILRSASNLGLVLGPVPNATFDNPNPTATPRSTTPVARWGENRAWSMRQRSDIDENITSIYLQANIATTVADRDLTGNIGFRHVRTDQSSLAIVNVNGDVLKGAVPICDGVGECRNDYAYQTLGVKYNDNLPSLNLNYSLTDSDQLRIALARVLSRPPIDRLAAADSEGQVDVVGAVPEFNYGSNTSPFLTPFIADQIDISYEHYMEETNGTFVIAAYHREIKSFIQDTTYVDYDFRANGFDMPDTWIVNNAATGNVDVEVEVENGNYTTAVNNLEGGFIRGLEVTYTQTFNFLPEYWAGLGVSGSFSLTDSEITQVNESGTIVAGDSLPFAGLVERSGNLTVFYSYENFETRLSTTYQDSFVGEILNEDLQPVSFAPEMVLDYQASYKFDSGLDLVFSVSNLTNEPNRSYLGEEDLPRRLQWFGRTYYAGFNYSF